MSIGTILTQLKEAEETIDASEEGSTFSGDSVAVTGGGSSTTTKNKIDNIQYEVDRIDAFLFDFKKYSSNKFSKFESDLHRIESILKYDDDIYFEENKNVNLREKFHSLDYKIDSVLRLLQSLYSGGKGEGGGKGGSMDDALGGIFKGPSGGGPSQPPTPPPPQLPPPTPPIQSPPLTTGQPLLTIKPPTPEPPPPSPQGPIHPFTPSPQGPIHPFTPSPQGPIHPFTPSPQGPVSSAVESAVQREVSAAPEMESINLAARRSENLNVKEDLERVIRPAMGELGESISDLSRGISDMPGRISGDMREFVMREKEAAKPSIAEKVTNAVGEVVGSTAAKTVAAGAALVGAGTAVASTATEMSKPTGQKPPPATQKEFYDKMYNSVYKAAKEKGVEHPEVIAEMGAAQASLETGFGKSVPNGNYFGIKGKGQSHKTTEYVDGKLISTTASFAHHENEDKSAEALVDLLTKNKRYAGVLKAEDAGQAREAIGKSGYASDPKYAAKLSSISKKMGPIEVPKAEQIEVKREEVNIQPEQRVQKINDGAAEKTSFQINDNRNEKLASAVQSSAPPSQPIIIPVQTGNQAPTIINNAGGGSKAPADFPTKSSGEPEVRNNEATYMNILMGNYHTMFPNQLPMA